MCVVFVYGSCARYAHHKMCCIERRLDDYCSSTMVVGALCCSFLSVRRPSGLLRARICLWG